MDKDRTVICNIISELEHYIESVRVEAIGWTHTDSCITLNKGDDPRLQNVPEMLERARIDLNIV